MIGGPSHRRRWWHSSWLAPGSRQVAVAYSCVVLWITLSAGVILFNKYLLSAYGFPYPVALTLMHMGFCSGTLPLNCTAPPGCEGPC